METIKSYLDAMFANMPNTAEVKKAKEELFCMMKDKYNDLIAEGETENSAIGTVISEFGNLDELAEDLGLEEEVKETREREKTNPSRLITYGEIMEYLELTKRNGVLVGIGVMLCIIAAAPNIIIEEMNYGRTTSYGFVLMFAFIAVAVGLFIFSSSRGSDWDFIKKELCQIDATTADAVKERKKDYKLTHAILMAVGVILCAFSWVPAIVADPDIFVAFMLAAIGVGVFILIYTGTKMGSYEQVLKINDKSTMAGTYGKEDVYINKAATAIMEVYWTTVTCIYLVISFITFDWETTWIIWPVAGILHKILKIVFTKEAADGE